MKRSRSNKDYSRINLNDPIVIIICRKTRVARLSRTCRKEKFHRFRIQKPRISFSRLSETYIVTCNLFKAPISQTVFSRVVSEKRESRYLFYVTRTVVSGIQKRIVESEWRSRFGVGQEAGFSQTEIKSRSRREIHATHAEFTRRQAASSRLLDMPTHRQSQWLEVRFEQLRAFQFLERNGRASRWRKRG